MPIACCVCGRVFFDNLSLVLHFECHLKDKTPTPKQNSRDLMALQSGKDCSFSSSQMNQPCHMVFQRINEFRHSPLPVSSTVTPDVTPRDVSLVHPPAFNSIPEINSSFGGRWNLLEPIRHSTMMYHTPASTSTYPLMYSQLGSRSFGCGSPLPPLQLREQNPGQGWFADYKNPQIKQLDKPIPEIIVISDDEEDDDNNTDEIDLTLKL
ncbi:UNVERIFIED_CONTAM: hypothetical protein Sindi_0380300 [Sesamum indicum]